MNNEQPLYFCTGKVVPGRSSSEKVAVATTTSEVTFSVSQDAGERPDILTLQD
jgi:hypothetical protein